MLDIHTGAPPPAHPAPPIEFVTIELMPLLEGGISVSLKSTIFDETDLDFLDQDIAHERVATLDELLALIRAHVRIGRPSASLTSPN
jgi:hypothetical protein